MRDVLYFLGPELPNDGEELRYSLRSIERNLPHGRVLVVGPRPAWLRNVVHIPWIQHPHGKWWDLLAKNTHMGLWDLSEVVYGFSDDTFVTEPKGELAPMFTNTLKQRAAELAEQRGADSVYAQIFGNTEALLDHWQVPEARRLNFEMHAPQVIRPADIPRPWFDRLAVPVWGMSAIGAVQKLDPVPLWRDFKVQSPEGLVEWREGNFGFLSSAEDTFFTSGVRDYLDSLFPNPSRFEL